MGTSDPGGLGTWSYDYGDSVSQDSSEPMTSQFFADLIPARLKWSNYRVRGAKLLV